MFRTQTQVIALLKKKDFTQEPLAKTFLTVLESGDSDALLNFLSSSSNLLDEVEKMDSVLQVKKTLDSPLTDSEKVYFTNVLEKVRTKKAIEYLLLFSDLLWNFRDVPEVLNYVRTIYQSCIDNDAYKSAAIDLGCMVSVYENLGLIYSYSDGKFYDLNQALLYFLMAFGIDKNRLDAADSEELYCYAKALQNSSNWIYRGDAFSVFKKAMLAGSEKAKEEFEKICRAENKCTFCGGQFKGVLVKHCVSCGKKKAY